MRQSNTKLTELRDRLSDDDRPIVRRIVESTGFFTSSEIEVAIELVDERLAKADASGYHFIFAERDGRTVGFACYGPIACTLGSFDLYWVAVDSAHQRLGIGRKLLAEAERRIRQRGGRHIYIETSNRPQYGPTRHFYQRCDYQLVALLKDFYNRGDDKVIFRKELDNSGA